MKQNIKNKRIFKKIASTSPVNLVKTKNKHLNNKENNTNCDNYEGNTEMMNEIYKLLNV